MRDKKHKPKNKHKYEYYVYFFLNFDNILSKLELIRGKIINNHLSLVLANTSIAQNILQTIPVSR